MSKNGCCPSEKSKFLLAAPADPVLLQLLTLAPADPISENRTFRVRTRLISAAQAPGARFKAFGADIKPSPVIDSGLSGDRVDDPQQQTRVEAGDQIVADDTHASPESFHLLDGIGFQNVEGAKRHETQDQEGP